MPDGRSTPRTTAVNRRQLEKLGVPPDGVRIAITAIQRIRSADGGRDVDVKAFIRSVVEDPASPGDPQACRALFDELTRLQGAELPFAPAA